MSSHPTIVVVGSGAHALAMIGALQASAALYSEWGAVRLHWVLPSAKDGHAFPFRDSLASFVTSKKEEQQGSCSITIGSMKLYCTKVSTSRVSSVLKNKRLILSNGECIPFDALIFALDPEDVLPDEFQVRGANGVEAGCAKTLDLRDPYDAADAADILRSVRPIEFVVPPAAVAKKEDLNEEADSDDDIDAPDSDDEPIIEHRPTRVTLRVACPDPNTPWHEYVKTAINAGSVPLWSLARSFWFPCDAGVSIDSRTPDEKSMNLLLRAIGSFHVPVKDGTVFLGFDCPTLNFSHCSLSKSLAEGIRCSFLSTDEGSQIDSTLESVVLDDNPDLSPEGGLVLLRSLQISRSHHHLRKLSLRNCGLDATIVPDLHALMKRSELLRELDVSDNNLLESASDITLEDFFELCAKLSVLSLQNVGLDDKAAGHLKPLFGAKSLMNDLDLSENAIGDACVLALGEALRGCKNESLLRKLNLEGCQNVSERGVKYIAQCIAAVGGCASIGLKGCAPVGLDEVTQLANAALVSKDKIEHLSITVRHSERQAIRVLKNVAASCPLLKHIEALVEGDDDDSSDSWRVQPPPPEPQGPSCYPRSPFDVAQHIETYLREHHTSSEDVSLTLEDEAEKCISQIGGDPQSEFTAECLNSYREYRQSTLKGSALKFADASENAPPDIVLLFGPNQLPRGIQAKHAATAVANESFAVAESVAPGTFALGCAIKSPFLIQADDFQSCHPHSLPFIVGKAELAAQKVLSFLGFGSSPPMSRIRTLVNGQLGIRASTPGDAARTVAEALTWNTQTDRDLYLKTYRIADTMENLMRRLDSLRPEKYLDLSLMSTEEVKVELERRAVEREATLKRQQEERERREKEQRERDKAREKAALKAKKGGKGNVEEPLKEVPHEPVPEPQPVVEEEAQKIDTWSCIISALREIEDSPEFIPDFLGQ